ncbi:MAG: hypothetical protein KJ967_03675, partial [Elusimicrobia bacterium]|nr:hypothetical protein [Elusimicrobiota bacterium]
MFKSGKRIHLEIIKLVVIVFFIVLLVTGFNFYLFLRTVLPSAVLVQSKLRIIIFGAVSIVLMFGITALLVKWFTYNVVGPIPRLQREIKGMVATGKNNKLFVRKEDKLSEF